MKKKTIKRYILWTLLLCLVAGLAVMPMLAVREQEEEGTQASVLSATAKVGSVSASIRTGGTLSAVDSRSVKLPQGVKITEFLVKNGDVVSQGDPVARVDRVSVMEAVLSVQDSLDYIRKQITAAEDDTISSSIRTAAGGRVKQVFAQTGDSVEAVMLENGALAVLSLDGMMAVRVERKTDMAAGDSVIVKLSGGDEVTGRVESNLGGQLVVTVEDEGYAVGEKVTLITEDAERLGSGELYVHNAWKATGYSGTVKTVYAREEATLSEGAALFALTDTEYTGQLEHWSGLHREYEALLEDLFQMYETEVLTAPCDGTVSGVDENSTFLLSAVDGEADWFAELLRTDETQTPQWTVMLLSSTETVICTGTDTEGLCKAEKHIEGCAMYCTGRADCSLIKDKKHKATCLTLCSSAEVTGQCIGINHKPDCIEACEGASETGKCPATGKHKPGCIETCLSADGSQDCPATGTHKDDCLERCDKTESCFASVHHYPECLSLCTGSSDCPARNHREDCAMSGYSYYAWAGLVRQVGEKELIVAADPQTRYALKNGRTGIVLAEEGTVNTELMLVEQVVAVAEPSAFVPGDVVLFWTAYDGQTAVRTGETVYSHVSDKPGTGQSGGQGGMDLSGMLGGITGGIGSLGAKGQSGTTSEETELFPLEGSVLLTVTDNSAMCLQVTVDERDVAAVYPGQAAQVEIMALKDTVLDAVVTDIGLEGVNNGGSSKFTLELTLPWQEEMLSGMNATVTIPLYTKMEVLTLPVAALTEERGRTVVYTALDPETGEPCEPVEVTTGVSDGETVEIITGLQSGTQVYYSYYDILELDNTAKADRFGMLG